MATSLASQLQKMRAIDRAITTEKAQRIRASFLFEGGQAANIDNQTVFDIGRDGLNELRRINRRFDVYATTLFSEAVKDLDRVLQTKEENKKLDESIRSFLFQLAPHFLTKPAGKALEWLIRRFRIQEFNAKDILAAFFAYHETKAFLTLLTIITFDTSDMDLFGFLVTQRKARRLLDRATLMAQCLRDRSLMAFICDGVFSATRLGFDYPGLHSFYAMLMSQYIGQLPVVEDSTVWFVVPYVIKGLDVDNKDAQLASYLVLGSLASRITFKADALEKTLCAVAQSPMDVRAMTMCLIQLLQTQATAIDSQLSLRFLGLLSAHKDFTRVLGALAASFDIELFMQPLVSSLAHFSFEDAAASAFLSELIPALPTRIAPLLCEKLVKELLTREGESQNALEILDLLQLRYMQQLEDAIGAASNQISQDGGLSEQQREAMLKKLYSLKMRSGAGKAGVSGVLPLKETATTLFLSMNHADSGIRLVAAKALGDIVTGKNKEFALPKEDSSSLILERLEQEDDGRVLDVVLSLPLVDYIAAPQLVSALSSLIESDRVPLADLSDKIVGHLLSVDTSSDAQLYAAVVTAVFPYLLCVKDTAVITKSLVAILPTSAVGKHKNGWLTSLAKTKKLAADDTEYNARVIEILAAAMVKGWSEIADDQAGLWVTQLASGNAAARTTAFAIGAQAVAVLAAKGKADECVVAAAAVIKPLLATMASESNASAAKLDDNLLISTTSSQGWTSILFGLATEKSVTGASIKVAIGALSVILSVLPSLIKLTPHGWIGASAAANTEGAEARYREFLRTTFVAVVSRPSDLTDADGILIGRMLNVCMGSDWAQFLASQWLSGINAVARSRCLLSFQALVKHSSSSKTGTVSDYQTVLPSLIVALLDDDMHVRGAAAACIQALKSAYPAGKDKKAHRKSSKGGESEQDIYMYDEFYGSTSDKLEYLPLGTVSVFVQQLASQSDVLAEDAYAVKHQLAAIMNKGHVGGTATAAKLNSKMRESVVAFLLSHVAAADGVLAQLQISLLETMELVTSQLFVSQLFPLVTSHTKSLEHIGVPATGSIDDKLTHSLFKAFFSPSNASAIAGGSDKHFDTLLKFVKGVAKVPGSKFAEWSSDLRAKAYLQQVAFEYLTADFVASLGSQPALASITQCLFDVATLGNSYYVPGATKATVRDLFSKVPLDPATVSESLTVVAGKLAQDDSDTPRSGKRARGSHTKSPVDVLPELSTLLEYVQCSVLLSTNPILAPALFSLLSVFVSDLSTQTTADEGSSESLAAQAKELVSIDYLKQLVLTMLTRIFDEANKAGAVIEESVVRVDVIVQSIRTSSSPQTHNQTLLLLAAVAVQHPQAVLHHVMAIFTFMGANVLRQDDEYSFRVLNQTLEKVIPPLVKAKPGEQRISKHEEVALAGPILRVFVDTLSHIPRHRRMALFTSLVKSLGVDTYASAVCSLLLEKNAARLLKSSKGEGSSIDDQEDIYSFTLSLAHEFDAQQQVAGAELLLQDLILLPAEMDAANADDSELKSAAELLYIDLPHMNSKQLRTYRLVVLDFVHRLLTSQQFRSKYRTADLTPEVSQQLSSAVSTVLELITKMSTQYGQLTQKQRLTTQASDRAWKQSIHIAYNVIDDVNSLMDRRSFVQTVARLLAQTDYKIRRKVLALAQKRIEAFDTRLYEADAKPIDDMLELVGSVVDVVDEKVDESAEGFSQKEFVANKQAALLCVAAAARKFASLRPVLFTKLVKRVSGQESLDSAHPVVVSAALVTLAVLCSELGSRLIPSLPMFLPSILKHMHAVTGNYRSASADDVAVLLSAMGAMETVVENMSAFLVPSLAPLFTCLLNPVLRAVVEEKAEESDDESEDSVLDSLRSQVLAKVDVLFAALAKSIPTRQLLPAQFAFYQKEACKQGPAVIVPFVQFVGRTGGSIQRTQLLQFYKPLFKFFLSVFDIARNPAIPVTDARAIEDTTLDAFMRFVVKLSENLFKPLFLSFVDWATTDALLLPAPVPAPWLSKSTSEATGSEQFASEARLRVFFRVLNVLFDKLKSIITPYYSSVIDVAIAQLTRFGVDADSVEMQDREDREEKPVPSALWQAIVRSVYQSALHDTSDFWTEDTFNKICKPLVAQLGNTKVAEGDAYEVHIARVREFIAPAVSQLAVAVSNDAMWKRINMDVMMKSRADAPAVRVGALMVQQAFYDKLGEEFLILLPETIPYLAELLEDDDHRVERATQETIKTIESYLGESLQSYLR